ncbi:MAG: AAA family ATPase [Anaerolineae bacterium]|nr:AAA family ATPase [Anaerolineae bacterium]
MLIILFGQPGAGKNFAGRIFAEDFGFTFYDADDDLPPEMRAAIQHKQIATDAMRAAHLVNIIARVAQLQALTSDIVVSGGFFKEKQRRAFVEAYPDARFVLVETALEIRRQRLRHRQHHLADLDYAEKIFAQFEPPQLTHAVLENDAGRAELKTQITQLLHA